MHSRREGFQSQYLASIGRWLRRNYASNNAVFFEGSILATVKSNQALGVSQAKAVHWRKREAAEWAARHGAVDTFALDLEEILHGRPAFRQVPQAKLLARLGDPAWKVVGFTWYSDGARRGRVLFNVQILPASLMRAHTKKDVEHYVFEMPPNFNFHESLKESRSKKS